MLNIGFQPYQYLYLRFTLQSDDGSMLLFAPGAFQSDGTPIPNIIIDDSGAAFPLQLIQTEYAAFDTNARLCMRILQLRSVEMRCCLT